MCATIPQRWPLQGGSTVTCVCYLARPEDAVQEVAWMVHGGEVNMGGWLTPPGAFGSISGISFGSVSTMSGSGSGSVGVAGRLEG